MSYEEVAKIVSLILSIITVGMAIYKLVSDSKHKLREEYKFAKEFLGQNINKLHPFVREKGYAAIAGSSIVTQREIEYILSLLDPVQCINDYKRSTQLFVRDNIENQFQLVYRKKYQSSYSRGWRKGWYLLCYFAVASIAVLPLFYPSWFGEMGRLSIFMTLPVFGFYSWMAVNAYSKIVASERLIKAQDDHESRKQKESSESKNS